MDGFAETALKEEGAGEFPSGMASWVFVFIQSSISLREYLLFVKGSPSGCRLRCSLLQFVGRGIGFFASPCGLLAADELARTQRRACACSCACHALPIPFGQTGGNKLRQSEAGFVTIGQQSGIGGRSTGDANRHIHIFAAVARHQNTPFSWLPFSSGSYPGAARQWLAAAGGATDGLMPRSRWRWPVQDVAARRDEG